jgi:hypothetical protein
MLRCGTTASTGGCEPCLVKGIASRKEGVGAALGSCSQTVISVWHSRLLGDNRPQTGLYPRCRERRGLTRG